MQTQTLSAAPKQNQNAQDKIRQLRELFADAPELGRTALENVVKELTSQVSEPPAGSAPVSVSAPS